MPQYPDLRDLQNITDPFAMLQAGQMAYDANEMARQEAVKRELDNARAAQIDPLQIQYQSLLNQDAESRLPSTKADAILNTLKAEQGLANQPRALEEARFNFATLPESKKQEFLKRLPQTITELKMLPPEAQAGYTKAQASKFGFDPATLDSFLSTTKDLPAALTKMHQEMSLNSPSAILQTNLLGAKNDAAYEKAMAKNETDIVRDLIKNTNDMEKLRLKLGQLKSPKDLEEAATLLLMRPDFDTNPEVQTMLAKVAKQKLIFDQSKLNQTGAELIGTTKPTERAAQAQTEQTPLANKPAAPRQATPENVTMDVQKQVLKYYKDKLDPAKSYKVIKENGQYKAVEIN